MDSHSPAWYKDAVFYELYIRAFYDRNGDGHGDLAGLGQKLDYIKELGINCIWLLPFYVSPLKDDGYDTADYYNVHPNYGTVEEFKQLVRAAHARDIRVIIDLVVNHTSDQHPWFQEARSDPDSPYRDYYVWSDTDQRYQGARIIFIDSETSNWTWDPVAEMYYWHRFYSFQPDLNFDNPAVRQEMLNIMQYWLDMGVDGFRVDAVPYLYERDGTNCENLPETHGYLKEMRRFIDENYPDRLLLCEANQWPIDVRPYFGDGDEFHMGFHFPLMPRIFMAMRSADITPLVWVFEQTPPIPESCQWCTFLRNHDELTLEMVTEEERQWMWREYAPEPRMRLNLGIRRRLAPLLDNHRGKIELANSLLFTMIGSPILYYGDEIGMGDNIWLNDRDGVRTPMQWDDSSTGGFSVAPPERFFAPVITDENYSPLRVNVSEQLKDPGSLLNTIRKMIEIRKKHLAFGHGNIEWLRNDERKIAAYWRIYKNDRLLILNNISAETVIYSLSIPEGFSLKPEIIFGKHSSCQIEAREIKLQLDPYQYVWFQFPDNRDTGKHALTE